MASTCLRVPQGTSAPRQRQAATHSNLAPTIVHANISSITIACGSVSSCTLAAAGHAAFARRRTATRCQAAAAPQAVPRNSRSSLEDVPGNQFAALGVDAAFVPGLMNLGISTPSPVQEAAIPCILEQGNVAIQSYTGSGKTLAYLLPVLTLALQTAEYVYNQGQQEVGLQVVIVTPSQELAMQVVRVAQALLPPEGRSMVQQCIGGANPNNQVLAIQRNKPLIVVGTPGRLAEFMRTNVLRVFYTPRLVLDEADQLLAPQFAEDMATINAQVGCRVGPRRPRRSASPDLSASTEDRESFTSPEANARRPVEASRQDQQQPAEDIYALQRRQTILVSATLSQTVLKQTAKWCPEAQYITAGGPEPTLAPEIPEQASDDKDAPDAPGWGWGVKGWGGPASDLGPKGQGSAGGVEGEALVPSMPPHLKHYYMVVEERHKVDGLRRLVHGMDLKKALVFMNWQERLKDVQFKLRANALKVAVLHGEMNKVSRQCVLNDFIRGRVRILVVSDVVARGLDIPLCDAVFHLELPSSAAHYAHRAGRTGRMGAPGSVISIVTPHGAWVVHKMSKRLGVDIQEVHVANGQLQMGPAPGKQKRAGNRSDSDAEVDGQQQQQQQQQADETTGSKDIQAQLQQEPQQQKQQKPGLRPGSNRAVDSSVVSGAGSSSKAAGKTPASAPAAVEAPVRTGKGAGKQNSGGLETAKGARVAPDNSGEYESVIYDDEDEIELTPEDETDLDTQLQQLQTAGMKTARRGGRSAGNHRRRGGEGQGEGGKLPEFLQGATQAGKAGSKATTKQPGTAAKASTVKAELAAELAELRAEKAALRQQRSKAGERGA